MIRAALYGVGGVSHTSRICGAQSPAYVKAILPPPDSFTLTLPDIILNHIKAEKAA